MTIILFQRSYGMWGFQIGRLYAWVPFWRYGGILQTRIGWDR